MIRELITAINDQPASDYTLEQLRQMFKKEGESYGLKIDGKVVTLTTRRLI